MKCQGCGGSRGAGGIQAWLCKALSGKAACRGRPALAPPLATCIVLDLRPECTRLRQAPSNSQSFALWLFLDGLMDRVRCMLLPATACRCADATLTVRLSWWAPAPRHHHRWRRCTANSAVQALWREHPALVTLLVPTYKICLLLDNETEGGCPGGKLPLDKNCSGVNSQSR